MSMEAIVRASTLSVFVCLRLRIFLYRFVCNIGGQTFINEISKEIVTSF